MCLYIIYKQTNMYIERCREGERGYDSEVGWLHDLAGVPREEPETP
jgi:hypothetical protein